MVGLSDLTNKDLALSILNTPHFPVLDFIVFHNSLVTPWKLLGYTVDEDEDYRSLQIERGLEFAINPRRLGLIQEPVVDPNLQVLRSTDL